MKFNLFKKKSKFENFLDKYNYELLSFLLPIVVFLIGLAVAQALPVGKNLITIYDGKVQYPGFAAYFGEVLRGKESLFYSFKGSLGFNFFGAAIYYLFNPLNLLLIFFKPTNIQFFYCITILTKIGLSGLSMFILLKYKSKGTLFKVLLSMTYALSAYNVIYYSNYMWFDTIVLFPIVVLGLKKMVYERKNKLYFIALFLSIFFNFYIGFMICIFNVIYFIYLYSLLDKHDRNKKIIFDFLITSFLAGVCNAIVLIPILYELSIGKATGFSDDFTKYNAVDWDALKIFYKFTPGNYSIVDISYGSPNVYCTLFTITFCIFYFFNKKISKKEKIAAGIVLLFYMLSFTYNLIDYSWHMFQKPIWYPARYSFTFVLFLILLADKCIENIDEINISLFKTIILAIILTTLITVGAIKSDIISNFTDVSKYIFFFLSLLVLFQYIVIVKNYNKIFKKFLILLFLIEIASNTLYSLRMVGNRTSYSMSQTIVKNNYEIINYINNNEKENSFYRTYIHAPYINNNGLFFNYNGINYFSSVRNDKVMHLFEDVLGLSVGDHCNVSMNADNPILNVLLGIKYLTASTKEENIYNHINTGYVYQLYKNEDAASLGFMVYDNLDELEDNINIKEYINNINNIVKHFTKEDNTIINKVDFEAFDLKISNDSVSIINNEPGLIKYHINTNDDGYLIIPRFIKNGYDTKFEIDGKKVENIQNNYFVYYIPKNSSVEFEYNVKFGLALRDVVPYYIKKDDYDRFVKQIKSNEFNITEYKKDDYIKGTIIATQEKNIMFTTIAADKGWSVYVDGVKTKYDTFEDALITLKLTPGTHTVEFKYFPTGLKEGIIISSIFGLISVYYLTNKKRK